MSPPSHKATADATGFVFRCAPKRRRERVRGIEPPCAAWEAAVLPLNYTRVAIFDFRFSRPIIIGSPNNFKFIDFGVADCNRTKSWAQIAASAHAIFMVDTDCVN